MRLAVAFIIGILVGCALLASHQKKPFPLLIDEAQASMIVCNPQPTPELIRWNKSRITRT